MARPIDADALEDRFDERDAFYLTTQIKKEIRNAPTISPDEVRGVGVITDDDACPVCGCWIPTDDAHDAIFKNEVKFCYNCGTRLRIYREAIDRLAAYEDTGLEPEQVKDAIRIAERIATADYPHNFQRERSDIVDYMRWITDVMRDAKAWWNARIKTRADAEKAMEVSG